MMVTLVSLRRTSHPVKASDAWRIYLVDEAASTERVVGHGPCRAKGIEIAKSLASEHECQHVIEDTDDRRTRHPFERVYPRSECERILRDAMEAKGRYHLDLHRNQSLLAVIGPDGEWVEYVEPQSHPAHTLNLGRLMVQRLNESLDRRSQ